MERIAGLVGAALLLVGCPSGNTRQPTTQPTTAGGPESASITVYRDGDTRLALASETIYRPDGNAPVLKAVTFAKPIALVVEATRLMLESGRQQVGLPRIPSQANASSIWVQSIDGAGGGQRVVLESVEPRRAGATDVLGRRVRTKIGETTINGTVVEFRDSIYSIRSDDGTLWMLVGGETDIAIEREGVGGAVRPAAVLRAAKAGEHLVEIGYTTPAIDWTTNYLVDLASSEVSDDVSVTVKGLLKITNGTDTAFVGARLNVFSGMLSKSNNHPIALWTGVASIDAHDETVITLDAFDVTASIGYEYRPLFRVEDGNRSEPLWGLSATTEVRKVLWLEPVEGAMMVAGRVAMRAAGQLFEAVLRKRVTGPEIATLRLDGVSSLRGSRNQIGTRKSPSGDTFTENIEIVIENRSSETRTVKVVDDLVRSARFELIKSEPEATVRDRELHFELEVKARSKKKARYTVRYSM